MTFSADAGAALTTIPDSVPVRLDVTVSVAFRFRVPAS